MKSIFLTSDTLTRDLQTLDNLLVLKILDESGYEIPEKLPFEAGCWGDHMLVMALNTIFGCLPEEIEVTRTTSNKVYQDRLMVLSIDGYDDWIRLKEKYPEMSETEVEMCSLSFDCDYTGIQLSIHFQEKGIAIEDVYETSYCHTLIDDFLTLKDMWTEALFFWRRKEFEENGSIDSGMENHSSETTYEISQCA
ncbi:hypothetical protein [Paenibacillus periandrae]|uniref:hypothetical protein n=1 Tax=Paenibacillus periandrae TaxID=1761741 RepID=UPI001F09320A|nr:hypothetical protein [Paenibacillus periandrae]